MDRRTDIEINFAPNKQWVYHVCETLYVDYIVNYFISRCSITDLHPGIGHTLLRIHAPPTPADTSDGGNEHITRPAATASHRHRRHSDTISSAAVAAAVVAAAGAFAAAQWRAPAGGRAAGAARRPARVGLPGRRRPVQLL